MKTTGGNTIVPESFPVKNVFVDELVRVFTPSETVILLIAFREIFGWEVGRKTLRNRIALSRFAEKSGLSRNTVRTCLAELNTANILLPIGEPTQDGQEFELNVGDQGEYDWGYLTERDRKGNGNRSPTEGMAAMNARRDQVSLPYVGVGGGSTIESQILTAVQPLDHLRPTVGSPAVQPLHTSKYKIKEREDIDQPHRFILLLADAYAFEPATRDWLSEVLTARDEGGTLTLTVPIQATAHIAHLSRVGSKLDIPLVIRSQPQEAAS